ncbi:TetR/AcrR family transcriptional regulator [Chryseobacterium sp.]|uniref:TetR/AcrR family transcriptional regulator n=1 Tax=Chryseobacterium sp. TaxID=1871047 RepID=UPI0025C70E2B|nr:TetR/AcrR family transcriptional regulator [Chryseobacterium sp.]
MSKADKTRQFIIEKTASLFNCKGYASTSISDITEATGLTKGSIYGNFENKEEVALEVYKHNAALVSKHMMCSFGAQYSTCLDKLRAMVDFYKENWDIVYSTGGCPLMNAATEADDTFPTLRTQVKKSFEEWADKTAEVIREGQLNGEIRQEYDAEEYSYLFIMLIEGGLLLSKTSGEKKYLDLVLNRILIIIDGELTA